MPVYEYKCNQCQSRFELLRRLSDKSDIKCNRCGSTDVERIISNFACGGSSYGVSGCSPSSFS
ncbi:regulatory protein, FmdB family [Dehalogenimonas lykanthroporepellens BL-DC-9]|jgi:putative FmdB family regulatory protein|nr:regulatory protein, FmdB family [Dehalogenimonas lykanthroporepellens BL-DC-9]